MERKPNSEQTRAIEHNGGMVLNAGAGSGKTFVLVKHLIYLTEKFFQENNKLSREDLSKALAKFYSSMVFMSFTTKAAGELAGRIREEIAKKAHDPKWELAERQVSHLFVGTIHAFCMKLLSQGYVTEIGPDINILNKQEFSEKIEILVSDFYEKIGKKLEISELLLNNLDQISKGFESIFGSVELRSKWKEWDPRDTSILSFKSFMQEALKLNSLGLLNEIKPSDFNLYLDKGWGKKIDSFLKIYNGLRLDDESVIPKYLDFFEEIKPLRGPSEKDNFPLGKEVMGKMGEFKDLLKDFREKYSPFFTHSKKVESWARTFKDMFDFIEDRIPYYKGLTYADLEYYVLRGLKNPSLAKRVRDSYSYFVVDEFQDTSRGQSEIFENLIDKKWDKFFCVGDVKQAIYGFRGGEIDVFLDYLKKMPKKEELKSNYRSKESLIHFNNNFFNHVFNISSEYQEFYPSVIPVSTQIFPEDSKSLGEGEVLQLSLKVDSKLGQIETNKVEAFGILELIKRIQGQFPEEEICILYRNRDPSMFLIVELLAEKLEFKAEINILDESDPVIGIYRALLEAQLLFQSEKNYFPQIQILVKSYLNYLKITIPDNLDDIFKQFIRDQKTIGMEESILKFLFSLNISNSNYKNNISKLVSLINLTGDNPERILNYFKSNKEGEYSFEFQMGKGKNPIRIMTVHASKGLEFDHVILGGIHTNEASKGGSSPLFGKNPGSFQWKLESKDKKLLKTPQYYLEDQNRKIKEGHESKRLLYVACTRAKNSLSYVNILESSYGERSWINAFRSFQDKEGLIVQQTKNINFSDLSLNEMNRPLFHRDDLGIIQKMGYPNLIGTLGDISVTSLAPLSECPRKFYLKNICRFDDQSFSKFFDEEGPEVQSSSERGSKIHLEISNRLKNKNFSKHPDAPIQFALDYLSKFEGDYEIWSEKIFKFPLFGYMCSGIPDALLFPQKELPFMVVDFKTGSKSELSHLFQLYAYAYGAYQLGLLEKNLEIKLVLLYLDLNEAVELVADYEKIELEVFRVWKNLYNLDQVNLNHCKECSLYGLCYS